MGTLRPARCYTKFANKPFTRYSKTKPRQSYVKGVPASKIHHFEMGEKKVKFDSEYHLAANQQVQIRSNALEAARVSCLKYLAKTLTEKGFLLKIRTIPHHVLRINAMATGAGADRFSQGMRKSFGSPTGQAARVEKGQKVITVKTSGAYAHVKEALKRASSKLPGTYKIVIGQ
jgi:large subunit ribosomal protein L10e